MADDTVPNRASNKEQPEGSRESYNPPEGGNSGNTGGITNRPLADEQENQEEVPPRGQHKDEQP